MHVVAPLSSNSPTFKIILALKTFHFKSNGFVSYVGILLNLIKL
jgi:hypothetical protein